MKKTWTYKSPDPARVKEFSDGLGISTLVASLLLNRNIGNLSEARRFLNPELSHLHSPFLLPDMEKAVMRMRRAIDAGEKILVYGDRDVDGVSSIAILTRTLKNLGADVVWTVPSSEGYGLHRSILEKFRAEGVRLVITADCGTSAVTEIDYANQTGMDVIVTDHHLPPETLPRAMAIVNPNLKDSAYPNKEIAGCLVAFKFAYALMFSFNRTFGQDYVVVDLETTGLSGAQDEIVEIGAVLARNFVPVKTFRTLVKPRRPIPAEATAIHGITNAMVHNAPRIEEALPDFAEFIGDRTMIAHNARFDLSFLQTAYQRVLGMRFQNPCMDTLALSRANFDFPSHSLSALVRALGIERANAHRAMDDCLAALELFRKIEEKRDPRLQFFLEDQLDLVTLGTIADIVPLRDENRIVVKHGLQKLLDTKKVGLRKLLEESGMSKNGGEKASENRTPTAKEVSWNLTPLLNAAGRFSRADLTVRLLLTENEGEAWGLVRQIASLNRDRKDLQKVNLERFVRLAREQCDLEKDKIIFVVARGVEHGVTGIVANQIVREFNRPAVLLIVEEGMATGSSRSVPGFNLVHALKQCEDLLIRYGGHPGAAGLSVALDRIDPLRDRMKEIADKEVSAESMEPLIVIDMDLAFESITKDLIREIRTLEPYGLGNPQPVFTLKDVEVADHSLIGAQRNHLKVLLGGSEKPLGAVGWGMSHLAGNLGRNCRVDVAFELELNRWNGRETLRLMLLEMCGAQGSRERSLTGSVLNEEKGGTTRNEKFQ